MAFVAGDTWLVSFAFQDNNGNFAGTEVKYPAAMALVDVQTSAANLAAAMQAVSDARIVRYGITRELVNDDTSAIPATSEVERKLSMTLGTATEPGASRLSIPSPIFALEQPRTDAVDPNNAAFAALVDELTNGLLTPGNGIVTWFGDDITRVTRAVIAHRSRKPRT